MERKKKL